MGGLLRSRWLWQLAILPVRVLFITVVFVLLILVGAMYGMRSLLTRTNEMREPPLRFLMLAFAEGSRDEAFDRRFALFHPEMTLERFWRIWVQKRRFETTRDAVFVFDRDHAAVPHLGHFRIGERIDGALLNGPAQDYTIVPAALLGPGDPHFSVSITNQSGFGFGIRNADRLIFRATAAGGASDDVILDADGRISRRDADPHRECLGILVGAVSMDGRAEPLPIAPPRDRADEE